MVVEISSRPPQKTSTQCFRFWLSVDWLLHTDAKRCCRWLAHSVCCQQLTEGSKKSSATRVSQSPAMYASSTYLGFLVESYERARRMAGDLFSLRPSQPNDDNNDYDNISEPTDVHRVSGKHIQHTAAGSECVVASVSQAKSK